MAQTMEKMVATPAPIPMDVITATDEALVITGGVATGKTEALVQRVATLIADGEDPRQILVLCASPDAAARFRARLDAACAQATEVRVTTSRQLCLDLLATPAAQAALGRDARLLAPFEQDFLMEDLKTSAMQPKRIREMMKFFYKCMTELCDRVNGWLITSEEEAMFGLLKNCLGFSRGVIEPELAGLIAGWLLDDPDARTQVAVAHVLVDDYQMMARAGQVVANLLATKSIAVATDPDACLEVYDSYPYADGVKELLAANPQAEVQTLTASFACPAALHAENVLREDGAIDAEPLEGIADAAALQVMEAETPEAEMDALAAYIAQVVDGGTAPEDILVASPNHVWGRNVVRALAARGIAATQEAPKRFITGDVREAAKCEAARVLTGLHLVADPRDGVAWRSWCGFGNWQTNANAMLDLREYGAEQGKAIDAVLQIVDAQVDTFGYSSFPSEVKRIADAYASATALIRGAEGLEGDALLAYLTREILGADAQVPAAVAALTAPAAADRAMDAAAMAARAQLRQTVSACTESAGVAVTSYQGTAGYSPKVLVLCGFINGFFPNRDYFDPEVLMPEQMEQVHAQDAHVMAMVVGKATEQLVVSYFRMAARSVSDHLPMKINRICLKDKKVVALVEPSDFLRQMEG